MLSETQATQALDKAFPGRKIEPPISYRGLYVFKAISPDPDEGDFDPFFSVNQQTGEVRDFSVITDGDPRELSKLFLARQGKK